MNVIHDCLVFAATNTGVGKTKLSYFTIFCSVYQDQQCLPEYQVF
jgi:hypothetical protein